MSTLHPKKIGLWLQKMFPSNSKLPPELAQAKKLIAALDAGGVPLNPARINAIARDIGLDVSRKAPVEETIQRIREAIQRI